MRKASGVASNAVTEQSKEAGKQQVAAFAEFMELFSTSAITDKGKANRAAAKTVHGRETRQKRAYISTKMA